MYVKYIFTTLSVVGVESGYSDKLLRSTKLIKNTFILKHPVGKVLPCLNLDWSPMPYSLYV